MEYLIRECTESDLSELVSLCKKHAIYERVPYISLGKETALKDVLFGNFPKLNCYIIQNREIIGGYFTYTFDYSTWDAKKFMHLDCLYLEPEFRGHRVGESVFLKLKEIAKQNDCMNIQWQTPDFNIRAIKFYNRIGGIGKRKVRFSIDL